MWAFVDQTRRAPGYNQSPFLIDILTRPVRAKEETERQAETLGEIAQFFGIPTAAFQGLSIDRAWTEVIGPLFEEFERMMNRMKPQYITGSMRFDLSPQNELAVVYYDR
jgi:hypothetical protein